MQNRLIAAAEGGTVPCVPDEKLGKEGCTPGYWKQEHHFGSWAPAVPTGPNATKFFDVFTVCDQSNMNCKYQGLSPDLTLLQALNLGGGGFNALARHAAAAYLNAVNEEVDYGIKKTDIVVWVINAFKTGNSGIKDKLEDANEKYCPLGRSILTQSNDNSNQLLNEVESPMSPQMNRQITELTSYPNPFTDKAVINFTLDKAEKYTLNLYDLQGKLIRELKAGTAKAGELNQVNVEGTTLVKGMYFIRLVTKTQIKTVKLVLKK
jgi:hypothetical protein